MSAEGRGGGRSIRLSVPAQHKSQRRHWRNLLKGVIFCQPFPSPRLYLAQSPSCCSESCLSSPWEVTHLVPAAQSGSMGIRTDAEQMTSQPQAPLHSPQHPILAEAPTRGCYKPACLTVCRSWLPPAITKMNGRSGAGERTFSYYRKAIRAVGVSSCCSCYVKFGMCIWDLMRIFMCSHLTFTDCSFQGSQVFSS